MLKKFVRDMSSKNFRKYIIVGVAKTLLNLVMAFLLIDLWNPPIKYRPFIRLGMLVFIAIVSYYWYVWIGFTKKEEEVAQ